MIPHERAPVKHGKRKRRAAMALTDRCAALKCGCACPLFLHFFAGQPSPCVAGASERKMLFAFFLKGPTDMVARRARFGYTGLTPFYETNMGEGSMPVIMKLLSRRGALRALENARAALGDATPLKRDCGRLCGAACCQPDETGLNGMLLFPFEETYYRRPIEGFPFRLVDDDTLFKGGKRLVCEGTCPREHRPLACRIFPLRIRVQADALGDHAHCTAELDPRAWCVCPLLEQGGLRAMDQAFIAAVARAGDALIQNVSMLEALYNEQRLIDEMRQL